MINLESIDLSRIDLSGGDLSDVRMGINNVKIESFDPSKVDYQSIWTTKGKTNNDVDKNVPNLIDPTNFLVPSNYLWDVGSGYGEYGVNYATQYYGNPSYTHYTKTGTTIKVSEILVSTSLMMRTINVSTVPSYSIRVTGLTNGLSLRYESVFNGTTQLYDMLEDGIYVLPKSIETESTRNTGFRIRGGVGVCNITIEQIPLSDGLVSDGVDDKFVSAKVLPVLNDFTVIGNIAGFKQNNGILMDTVFYWYSDKVYIKGSTKELINPISNVIGFNSKGLIVTNESYINGIVGKENPTSVRFLSSINIFPIMTFHNLAITTEILNESQIRLTKTWLDTLKANNI